MPEGFSMAGMAQNATSFGLCPAFSRQGGAIRFFMLRRISWFLWLILMHLTARTGCLSAAKTGDVGFVYFLGVSPVGRNRGRAIRSYACRH
jgi:hypothetical protein